RLHQLLQMVAMIGNLPLGRPPLGNVRNQQDHADDASAVTQREAAQVDIERFRLIKWKERLVQQSNSLALKGIADRLLDPVDLEEAGQLAQRGTRGPVSTKVEQTFGGFVPDRAALIHIHSDDGFTTGTDQKLGKGLFLVEQASPLPCIADRQHKVN